MGGSREFSDPLKPRKALVLPPDLDMGSVKLDDLEFDLNREVARLKTEGRSRTAAPRPPPQR